MPKTCCFCQYTGNDRSYRNVGIPIYPDDMVCNLCDTQVDEEPEPKRKKK